MKDGSYFCIRRWIVWGVLILLIVGGAVYFYAPRALSSTKCEAAKHLDSPEEAGDCYSCHIKATPKIAQDWYESKHGVLLVKCFVCHGQPDGKGSIVFSANPDPDYVCRRCHDPAIKVMQEKYGMRAECNDCHRYHSNSVHHEAYTRTESKKTIEE